MAPLKLLSAVIAKRSYDMVGVTSAREDPRTHGTTPAPPTCGGWSRDGVRSAAKCLLCTLPLWTRVTSSTSPRNACRGVGCAAAGLHIGAADPPFEQLFCETCEPLDYPPPRHFPERSGILLCRPYPGVSSLIRTLNGGSFPPSVVHGCCLASAASG